MPRLIMGVMACLTLAGCWMSERRLFGDGDWAHVNFTGKYNRENANGDKDASVVLSTQPNGLIVGTATELKDHTSQRVVLGLVPIKGGSGKYFLAVDRSDGKDTGDIYLVAHRTDDGALEMFWPDCEGTAPVPGMTVEKSTPTEIVSCTFTTKAALMTAGLQAEKFLSAKHVIEIAPFGRLAPDDGK